jgi:hypothetical protein
MCEVSVRLDRDDAEGCGWGGKQGRGHVGKSSRSE